MSAAVLIPTRVVALLLLAAVLLSCGPAAVRGVEYDRHDCLLPAPGCTRTLAEDPLCRGVFGVTNKTAWRSLECDYVVYQIPAKKRANKDKYIMIHAGGLCDTYTEILGDWASQQLDTNLWGQRACEGFHPGSACMNGTGDSCCTHLHVTIPSINKIWGPGWNPPGLEEVTADPDSRLLYLHEFDNDGFDYSWGSPFCNETAPKYMCVNGAYPDYDEKFEKIKKLMEEGMSMSKYFKCKLEVVDARNSTAVPGTTMGVGFDNVLADNDDPTKPCSGMFPAEGTGPPWAWEMNGKILTALKMEIEDANNRADYGSLPGKAKRGSALEAFLEAIDIALSP